MKVLIYLTIFLSLNSGCKKKPTGNPVTAETSPELKVIWRTSIVPDPSRNITISMNPVLYDELVIFGTELTMNEMNAPILFMDTATGEIKDYWTDYLGEPAAYYGEKSLAFDKYLFLSSLTTVNCINLETRETQWQSNIKFNFPGIYANEDYLYRGISYKNEDEAALLRTPVSQINWDTVYAFSRTDRRRPNFDAAGFGQLANGDEVVAWKNRSYVPGNGSMDRTDIFSYNLSADTLMWRNTDINFNSGPVPLKVEDQRVYGLVENHAFCIDLLTGDTLWFKDIRKIVKPTFDFGFFNGDLFIHEDAVLIKGDSDELISLNKVTGETKFVRQDIAIGFGDRFTYFEGKLFFSAGELVIIDALTGDLLNKKQANQINDIQSRIVIDPNRRVMYFHNGREAFCVKIPPNL